MSSLTVLNMYLLANLLLVLAAAGLAGLRRIRGRALPYRHQLHLAYGWTVAALLLPLIAALPVQIDGFEPNAQVWSGTSMRESAASPGVQQLAISMAASEISVPLHLAGAVIAIPALGGAAIFLLMLWRDARRIRRVIAAAQTIVRRGSLRILAAETVHVPFSFWLPARHFIVVPVALTLRPDDLRMAVRHEVQHHRQMDTKVLYALQLLRAVFFLNPAVHWLHRMLTGLQEFACDEAVVAQRSVTVRDYCGCLLRVAESALDQRRAAVCSSMLGRVPRTTLRERIEVLLQRSRAPTRWTGGRGRSGAITLSLMLFTVMTGVAVAASGTVQDRRISLQQAHSMASNARAGSDFPIVVNARVLAQLNRLLGTPDGRAYARASLQRMAQYQGLIAQKTAQYGLPAELIAVPLAESGFRNLPRSANPRHGAGIWMFIAPTARRFGLTVDEHLDERLDVTAATDAAMRMLAGLDQDFADWGLALLAYNAGNRQVQRAIEATGSRDVWHIIEHGYENDTDYVASVMAALLIIRNPAALQ